MSSVCQRCHVGGGGGGGGCGLGGGGGGIENNEGHARVAVCANRLW